MACRWVCVAVVEIITLVLDGQVMGSTRYPVLQTELAKKTGRTKQRVGDKGFRSTKLREMPK